MYGKESKKSICTINDQFVDEQLVKMRYWTEQGDVDVYKTEQKALITPILKNIHETMDSFLEYAVYQERVPFDCEMVIDYPASNYCKYTVRMLSEQAGDILDFLKERGNMSAEESEKAKKDLIFILHSGFHDALEDFICGEVEELKNRKLDNYLTEGL
jgi:hypothetical protein